VVPAARLTARRRWFRPCSRARVCSAGMATRMMCDLGFVPRRRRTCFCPRPGRSAGPARGALRGAGRWASSWAAMGLFIMLQVLAVVVHVLPVVVNVSLVVPNVLFVLPDVFEIALDVLLVLLQVSGIFLFVLQVFPNVFQIVADVLAVLGDVRAIAADVSSIIADVPVIIVHVAAKADPRCGGRACGIHCRGSRCRIARPAGTGRVPRICLSEEMRATQSENDCCNSDMALHDQYL